ncbi:MAG: carbohydrate ABC transporter permease [Deinococcus sp.]
MMGRISPVRATLSYVVLLALSVIFLVPFAYMISISLASPQTNFTHSFTILPHEFHWANYVQVFTDPAILGYIRNSVLLVVFSVIGQVLASSLVAYAFARLRAPGKNIIFAILLATLMIPSEVTLIPQFVLFKNLGWINTLLPLIVPNFFGGAYNIFLLRQFMARIPAELDEAARIDGLGYFGIYWRIILPLMVPALAAVSIFTFTFNWGWFMGPLIYLNDPSRFPLALGAQVLSSTGNAAETPPYHIAMVASMLLTIPMLLVFAFGQRYVYELSITGSSGTK